MAIHVMSALLALAVVTAAIEPGLYDGSTLRPVALEQALQAVRPGQAVIVSEQHDVLQHHQNQLEVLRVLRALRGKVSVGLEFLSYPDQSSVDRFINGEIADAEFVQAVRWSGYPFEWYRPLIVFSRDAGGQTRALNAPASLTRALAQRGLAGLSDQERSLLPPDFTLGSDPYFARFVAQVGQHGTLSQDAIRNFFAAQSAWDDTMAWQSREYLSAHPDQILVIIVGDFHASYGGGLPDRLRARGVAALVISQVNGYEVDEPEIRELLAPDPEYGPRAHFVWLTQEKPQGE